MGNLGNLIVHIGADIRDFVKNMDKVQRTLTRSIGPDAMDLSKNLVGAFAGLGAGILAVGGASVKMAAEMEQSKIAFTTMLGSAQAAETFLEDLAEFAASTPFELPGLIESSKKLLAFGFQAEQIKPMLTAIGDAVAGLGGGAEEIDRVTRALGQMQGKGKVSAEEMNQLAELGIPAWRLLAEQIGMSIPEAMKKAEQGAISAGKAIPAILDGMSKQFGGLMDKQSQSLAGLWSTTKDNIGASMRTIGETLVQTFDLKTKLAGANKWLDDFAKALKEGGIKQALEEMIPPKLRTSIIMVAGAITGAMLPALKFMAIDAAKALLPLAPMIIAGAALAGIGLLIAKNWENPAFKLLAFGVALGTVVTVLTNAKLAMAAAKVATMALSAVTKVATAVQAAFNAVMSMNPIGFVIIGITVLIAAGIALYKNWETVKRVALNVWGAIKIAVLSAVAFVMEAYGKFVGFFNKAEGERIKANAAAMRAQVEAERDAINERNWIAEEHFSENEARDEDRLLKTKQREDRTVQIRATSAAAQQQSITDTANTADAAAKAQEHALDVLEYKLGQVDGAWEEYQAQVGDAAVDANYLAKQKQYLSDRLGVLGEKVDYLNGLYETSKAQTGEYSDATMKLGKELSAARVELTATRKEFEEISGPIADAKANLDAASKAVKETKDHIATVNGHLSEAKDKFEKTSGAVKDLQDANRDAGETIRDALGAMRDRIQDVDDQMQELKESSRDAEEGISDAFGAMKSSAEAVKDEISAVRSRMRDLASVRLAGEGALGDQLKAFEQEEALVRLAINRLKQSGAKSKGPEIAALEAKLEAIGLKKEEISLRIETEVDPLRDELKRLTDDSKELTFEQAKAAIESAKSEIDSLSSKHAGMTDEIDRLTTEYQNLVPSINGTTMTFDQAKASLETHKATIDANNLALTDLTATHTTMKEEYDLLVESVSGLVPKIGDATLSFDEAKTKVTEMKGLIEQNNAQLNGPEGLIALMQKQKETVDILTTYLGLMEPKLQTLIANETAAASALETLRNAATQAADALSSVSAPSGTGAPIEMAKGGVLTRPILAGEAGPEPILPLSWLDQRMRSISAGIVASLTGAAVSPSISNGQGVGTVSTGQTAQSGPSQVVIPVNLDGWKIAEYTLDIAAKKLRQTKRSMGSANPAMA